MRTKRHTILSIAAVLAGVPSFTAGAQVRVDDQHPTYAHDIAPIIARYCSPCHRPQGAGPFGLGTYSEVSRRARQIAAVTRSRMMPPWPTEPGYGEFLNQRLLS